MAKKDPIGQAIKAGKDVTQSGQKRVETMLRDVSKATDRQSKQLSKALDEFLERSRQETERIAEVVDSRIRHQFDTFGVATKGDLARLEAKVDALAATGKAARKAPAKRAPAKRAPAKRAPAKKAATTAAASTPPAPNGESTS
ncbi:MAG: phasin family protein [Acidimicrobiales bacterium]|jgi:polyhydroxyalkanoate synthesis regulator phasin|nr:phasin family protein [Acidimicrobiales bacterium]